MPCECKAFFYGNKSMKNVKMKMKVYLAITG